MRLARTTIVAVRPGHINGRWRATLWSEGVNVRRGAGRRPIRGPTRVGQGGEELLSDAGKARLLKLDHPMPRRCAVGRVAAEEVGLMFGGARVSEGGKRRAVLVGIGVVDQKKGETLFIRSGELTKAVG
jgi:hypothetical protein